MPSVDILKKRDRRENDLSSILECEKAMNAGIIRCKSQFQRQLEAYQLWKQEKGVEGIKF